MTRDASTGVCSFYINGVFQNTASSALGSTAAPFYVIGYTTGAAKQFDGDLDEMRIYNSVLSAAQVKADFKFMMNTNLYYNNTEVWP